MAGRSIAPRLIMSGICQELANIMPYYNRQLSWLCCGVWYS